jgi:hypothetical protein
MKIADFWMLRRVALVNSNRKQHSILRLLITANVISISPILVTLMMEALCSFATLILPRATRRNIPENGILSCPQLSIIICIL